MKNEHILYHLPVWLHMRSAKEHNLKRKWRENMQSSIWRKLANLLTFHSKASKTQIYWLIPVKISAKWLSLRRNNIISRSWILNWKETNQEPILAWAYCPPAFTTRFKTWYLQMTKRATWKFSCSIHHHVLGSNSLKKISSITSQFIQITRLNSEESYQIKINLHDSFDEHKF